MISSGARSALRVSTAVAARPCGVTLARAAWNSGRPGPGIVHCSCSRSDSSRGQRVAEARTGTGPAVRLTARLRLAGLREHREGRRAAGPAAARTTPRIGAGSIATPGAAEAAVEQRPDHQAAEGVADQHRRRPAGSRTIPAWWSIDLRRCPPPPGSPGAPGPRRRWPARPATRAGSGRSRPPRKRSAQGCQLVECSHRPWMNTTGTRAAGHRALLSAGVRRDTVARRNGRGAATPACPFRVGRRPLRFLTARRRPMTHGGDELSEPRRCGASGRAAWPGPGPTATVPHRGVA